MIFILAALLSPIEVGKKLFVHFIFLSLQKTLEMMMLVNQKTKLRKNPKIKLKNLKKWLKMTMMSLLILNLN